MREAVAAHVHDGDTVVIEGFTHLICFAAAHEIIRQRRRELTLARLTPDLICDQLIAAGCARKIIFSYSGNPGVGSLRVVRAEIEAGRLDYEEYSHFAMITRVAAGAAGLPFLPMKSVATEDLIRANPQKFELIDSRKISQQETWGHLAVCGGQVFVRELQRISVFRWQ